MDHLGYLAAAYAVVLLTLAGYAATLIRRERALHRQLRGGRPSGPPGNG